MPYIIRADGPEDKPHCLYKEGPDGEPEGEAIACHATPEEAEDQRRALYANEPGAEKAERYGGVPRDELASSDFVFGGDERAFPVMTPADVSDAVSSWGRYKGPHSFDEFKRRLIALCKRKGAEFVAALPDEWKEEMGKATKAGARHSKRDRDLLKDVHKKAKEIEEHALELGAELEEAQERAEEGGDAAKARHARDKCMECDAKPEVDVLWGEGAARAWFCKSCFEKWPNKGDVIKTHAVEGGEVPEEFGEDTKATKALSWADVGLSDKRLLIEQAFAAAFVPSVPPGEVSPGPWVAEIFEDHVIASDNNPEPWMWRVPYTIEGTVITFAPRDQWEQVARAYTAVKAAGDWELDVLGVPYGGPASKDSDGQWFDQTTQYHEDKWQLPIPAVYYHGLGPNKRPLGTPEYIGQAVKRWADQAGIWYRVVLDRTSMLARRVWEAAQKGIARASSGSIIHLTRVDDDGHIREWPVVELSIFDAVDGRQPANRYAIAVPAAKAVYDAAGMTLPDGIEDNALEAAPEAGSPAAPAASDGMKTDKEATGAIEMDEKELKELVAKTSAEAVAAALKAQKDAEAEAERKAKEENDRVQAAVKVEREKWEAEAAKARRLPGGMVMVPQYQWTAPYDVLTPGEHALVVDIMRDASRKGLKRAAEPSDNIVKALALKIEAEAGRGSASCQMADRALKAAGLKSDEIMYSTLSSYGDEWVGVLYSNQLWEQIRQDCWALGMLQPYSDEVPQGYESDIVPLESTDPTWYKVSQAADNTSGRPDVTVTSSQFVTGQKQITLAKMGCRVLYSGEMVEDSLVPFAQQAMRQIKQSGIEQMEHVIIDGDTTTTASSNINSIGGTPAGTEAYLLLDGFRHLALVTNTANSVSGGTLSTDDYLNTAKLLGAAGMYADITKVHFVIDYNTYWKTMQLAELKTKDVHTRPTIENGQLVGVYGFPVKPSAFMHYCSTARLANTSGKVDQTTTTNNTTGSILAVRWDQWRLKWKRRMTVETDRWPESDTNQIVAMVRWGLGYRDTEAAAISYNLTV